MRVPSKRTLTRLRMGLDTHVLEKGRPLIDGWYTRLPIGEQLGSPLSKYSATLCKYLLAQGIPVENTYLDPTTRKGKYIILDSTSSKCITWSLCGYYLEVPDQAIEVTMDGSSGASHGLQVRCNVIPCSTLDELVQQLRSTIDRLEGEKLCKACHYSVGVNNEVCCGMGMMSAPQCIGYIGRQS